jgi:lipopolysaccharide transport system permease protein
MTYVEEPPRDGRAIWAVAIDLALAVGCYLLASKLRLGPEYAAFLPGVRSALPWVVAAQLAALWVCRAYRSAPPIRKVLRLLIGSVLGTAVGSGLVAAIHGFVGIPRAAFASDALLFFLSAAAWRTGRALWRQAAARPVLDPEMIDRAGEPPTLKTTVMSLVRYRELIVNLVLKDLKLKYRGSMLGFVWSLVNPLVMLCVYTVAFTVILRVTVPGFVFYLLLGLLAWTFFSNSAAMATGAIIDSGSLMKSVAFPRAILPITTVLFNLVQYLLTIAVFLPLMLLLYRVPLHPAMLLFPVFLMLQVLFTTGVAFLLAVGTAFFRDIRHLLEIALSILFWMTPIVYSLSQVPEKLQPLLLLSPMSPFIVAYQQMFHAQRVPELMLWVIGTSYAVTTFIVGAAVFLSCEDQLGEQI